MQFKSQQVVRTIIALGVFILLMRYISWRTPIPGTSILTSLSFLALAAGVLGPLPAFLIGFIGHV